MTEKVVLEDIKSLTEACERCYRLAGLEMKQVAAELDLGVTHVSRMFNPHDSLNFPLDKVLALMDLCGNVLPLEWLAWRKGYALHSLDLTDVLRAIRDVLSEDGRRPLFKICENDRLEKV